MSFILDALKKSEMERQRQGAPGMVESGIVRPRPRLPLWAVALGALLAVNLIVLMVMLVRNSSGSSAPAAAHPAAPSRRADLPAEAVRRAATESAPVDSAASHFSPLDTPAQYAPEIPVANPPVTAASPAPVPLRPETRSVRRREPVLTDEDYKTDQESLPTINELSLTGAQALPDLHLDVHVYATQAAERFVFINMRKYHEGSTLQEGPAVERIRRDGVILNYQGLRFLLPRQ